MFDLYANIGDVENSRVNFYLIKNDKRSDDLCHAYNLNFGDEFIQAMLRGYNGYLVGFNGREIEEFNPAGNNSNSLAILGTASIETAKNRILNIARNCQNPLNNRALTVTEGEYNLIVAELEINNQTIYFISRYSNVTKSFKYKNIFMRDQGRFMYKDTNSLFAPNYNVDFAIVGSTVFIFNIGNFLQVTGYDDQIREAAAEVFPQIHNWDFLSSSQEFLSFSINKYFYQGIGKIAEDAEYLEQIQQTSAIAFKNMLLQKSPDQFRECDFNERNKLIVTKSNCRLLIKIIAKEMKYNIFQDIMEG